MRYKNLTFFLLLSFFQATALYSSSAAPKAETNSKEGEETNPVDVKKQYEITNDYVHTWLSFPPISAVSIFREEELAFKPQKGYMTVVMFLASWCLPCQKIFPKIHELQKKYSKLNSKFLFVFVNDTKEDAQGFAHEYKLTQNAVLANASLKTDFHNPQLPTIYMSDRRGWLLNRYEKMDDKDILHFEKLLQLATSY